MGLIGLIRWLGSVRENESSTVEHQIVCENCRTSYCFTYTVAVETEGFLGIPDSRRDAARAKVERAARADNCPSPPCPDCGWLQRTQVRREVRNKWIKAAVAILFIVGPTALAGAHYFTPDLPFNDRSAKALGNQRRAYGKYVQRIFVTGLMAGGVIAALLIHLPDPNSGDRRARRIHAAN
jgi:hypothetical protein